MPFVCLQKLKLFLCLLPFNFVFDALRCFLLNCVGVLKVGLVTSFLTL